ncbi:hypothetical protein BDP27DRAFT_1375682 [Rhodocollybia butyracea]|uniref:Methyltransferase domain-containing protein n=1 Tax=Rhodocollybia butyracea TaxID=206335 RepID=A0A9P5P560_9AGAR|nr:hypothetical protein BDP27DRAFT_1375682 [Rhodocollybia butyracea]
MAGNSQKHSFVSQYFLPSTEDERKRLDWQNRYMTKVVFDGKLICVPTTLNPGDELLETGTGTGIWLLDVARDAHPKVSLTGIDINRHLFPTEYPHNIAFAIHTVTNLPDSWSDRFKVANQRLLAGALTSEQWGTALSELYRVLKPGGWVQLLETGPETTAYSGPNTKLFIDAFIALYASKGLALDIHETILAQAGFVNVQKRTIAQGCYGLYTTGETSLAYDRAV